jgi:predicted nucleic acid-binding protein
MRLYADTSWWVAYKSAADLHHPRAITLFDKDPEAQIIWTPWQRVEVFNCLRQMERIGLLQPGYALQIIRSLEQEIRMGYWSHVEFDWISAVRGACEIAAEHSLSMTIRSMDLFHAAIAVEVACDGFVSFDEDQCALAKAAGLNLVLLPERGNRQKR